MMPERIGTALLLGSLAWGVPGPLAGQLISGRVIDATTEEMVGDATVTLLDAGERRVHQVITDAGGRFSIRVATAGRIHLRAERIGYRTVTSPPVDLAAGDTVEVEIRVATEAVVLAPLTVTAAPRRNLRNHAMDGFYERQRRGWGRFIGPAEIERLQPVSVTSLLQGSPGIRIGYLRGHRRVVRMRTGRGECNPTIYIDGHRIPDNEIDQWIVASSVRAVEIYRSGMETPAEFASVRNYNCGAVVIWTSLTADQS